MTRKLYILFRLLLLLIVAGSCCRGPQLHLYKASQIEMTPVIDLDLDVYWNYQIGADLDLEYDWQAEWYYGWDRTDSIIFGPIGYTRPETFNIRRYHTQTPDEDHSTIYKEDGWSGTSYRAAYEFGYWDILLWNQNTAAVQGLIIDENSDPNAVTGYTNPVGFTSRSLGKAVYQPEQLFSGYITDIDINPTYEGFEKRYVEGYDNPIWYRKTSINLKPCTYIYLTQLIIRNNNGKISGVDGSACLSGLARSVCLNTGISSSDAVSVNYDVRLKRNCNMKGEPVDIVGGRLLCFGMCNLNPNSISSKSGAASSIVKSTDKSRHYIDMQVQFYNGCDSTFVFDVTDQLQEHFKGGVLTVTIDMDTVKVPGHGSSSAFDAVVVDYMDGGTHEFEM